MHMSLWKFWAFAVFTCIWFVITLDYFAELPDGGSLDLALTEAQVVQALAALDAGPEHIRAYHAWGTKTLDMVFPLLLVAFLLTGLSRYVTQAFLWGFGALAVLYGATDYWENWLTLQILAGGQAYAANAWASLLKYAFLVLPLGVVLAGLLRESYKAALVRIGQARQSRES